VSCDSGRRTCFHFTLGEPGIHIFPRALASLRPIATTAKPGCHTLWRSQSRMQVHPMHQGCRYCSLASEEVAYSTSYCSAELRRGRPRQHLHSTNSPEQDITRTLLYCSAQCPAQTCTSRWPACAVYPSSTSLVHLTNELSSGILFCVGGPALMY
jgi:hypothetical protein